MEEKHLKKSSELKIKITYNLISQKGLLLLLHFGIQKLVEAMVLSQSISAFSPVISQIKSCPGECYQLTNLSVLLRRLFFFMAPPQQVRVSLSLSWRACAELSSDSFEGPHPIYPTFKCWHGLSWNFSCIDCLAYCISMGLDFDVKDQSYTLKW